MNILDYKRKALGYVLREGGGQSDYPTTAAASPDYSQPGWTYGGPQQGWSYNPVVAAQAAVSAPPIVATSGPSAGQTLAPVISTTGGGGPNVDAPTSSFVEGYESVNPDGTINRYDTQGNFVTTYTSNGSDIVGDFFAGIDSSLGLSKGLTAIGGGLADLDSALGLSKNAPAIVGLAASYFLPGIGQALGQSLVNAGVLTGAAATPAMATTIGTALAQTGVSVAQGKSLDEALTNAIISVGTAGLTQAFGADVKSAIGQITSNPIAQNAIFKAGTDVVSAVAQGKTGEQVLQGIGNSLVASVAGAAANELVKNIPGIDNLPDAAKRVVTSGIATSIQGGDGTKSMLNAALREGTNYVLDTLTATPGASAANPMAQDPAQRAGAGTVAGGATLDDIEATLAANGLQNTAESTPVTQGVATEANLPSVNLFGSENRSEPDDFDINFGAYQPPDWRPALTQPPASTPTPTISGENVTSITGGSGRAGSNYYAGQYSPTQPAANTGFGGVAVDIGREFGDGGGGDGFMDNPWGESGAVTSTTTGKTGETGMAQPASQTGGTDTSNADEWGDLQGAIDAATVRGINAKAPTFSEAFSSWRTALGANGTFPWTDPKTGITKVFTTDYAPATVAAISADPSAEATANPKLNTYVLGKLLDSQNIKSADFNPADLSGIEMASFFQNYIKATPEQQARLLNGSDASTYKVFDKLIKETAAVNPTGALAPLPSSGTGSIQEDPSTHYVDVAKAGLNLAASDLASLGVRGLQVIGGALDLDTATLQQTQKLLTDDKKKTLSTLVGYEKSVAGGIASGIESAATFLIGGPYASVATLTGMAANSSWLEGVEKNLSTEDNAKRTAVMTAAELVGEMLGVPGLKQVMKGIPVTGSIDEIISAFKRQGAGLLNEQASELLTTTMQFAADKFASFGITPNATYADFVDALKDTVVATAAGVGTSGSIATSARSLNNAIESAAATDRTQIYPSIVSEDAGSQNKPINTVSEIAAAFDGTGLPITAEVINTFATTPKSELSEKATSYADPLVTDATEAREIARELGYTNPSQQVLDSLVGPKSEADARSELDTFLESMSSFEAGKPVNAATAQEMMADLGLTNISDADAISLANQIVQSVPDDKLAPPADDFLDRTGVVNEGATDVKSKDDFLDKPGVTTEAPPVITSAEVSKIVTDALAANPSLTPDQVTNIVNDAVKTIPLGTTAADVQKIVDTAVKTIPTGPSAQDVSKIVTDALAANPSLTETQVTKVVNDAIAKVPAGVSTADVANAINTAIANIPAGLSTEDVSKVVTNATKDLATKEGVGTAITGATKDLATTKSVDDLKVDLTKAIDDAGKNNADAFEVIDKTIADLKAAGLTEQQVQDVVDLSVGGATKTLQDAIDGAVTGNTKALGDLQDQVAKDIGTVQKSVTDLEKTLVDTIAANEKAGLTRDEATQKALEDVATQMGTDKADVLKQIGTTETDLTKKVTDLEDALGKKIEGTEEALATKLDAQGKAFMDALVAQGMDQQTALETAIAAQTKLVTEGQNATNLRIDELVEQGMTYQQATQKAITEMSTGFTTQLTGAEKARQEQASAWEAQRKLDLTEAEKQRGIDRQAELDRAAEVEKARQTEITNQKAREAANLKTIQTGQLRGQMQTGLQGLIGGLQQQATQMAAPGVVETVKSTPGFDFGSPLNVGFFGGYESQKTPPKGKESLKIATGGYLDDLLEAIR